LAKEGGLNDKKPLNQTILLIALLHDYFFNLISFVDYFSMKIAKVQLFLLRINYCFSGFSNNLTKHLS
jgi:hypothetical protein